MRFMMIIKVAESGFVIKPELYAAMDGLIGEMTSTGVLLDMGGLLPSAHGARIRLADQKLTVTDGPFTEAREVIGGFAILKTASRDEALEMGRRFMQLHADILGPEFQAECEIRQMEDAMAAPAAATA